MHPTQPQHPKSNQDNQLTKEAQHNKQIYANNTISETDKSKNKSKAEIP